jgi:dTMP kinase
VDDVLAMNLFATEHLFPNLTLLFDIPPEVGLARINQHHGREVNRLDLEQLSFHQRVRETYLMLAKRFADRFVVIDASLPMQDVIERTYQVIRERLV